MSYRVTLAGVSDVGRVRKRNEDSLHLLPELGVAVLADGMGGHPGGDVASRLAATEAAEALRRHASVEDLADADSDNVEVRLGSAMAESVLSAHRAVRAEAEHRPELSGMGTTLTALVVHEGTGAFVVGHVGDSRAYRLRDGTLTKLTHDDTWVQTQVDAARITPEQARRHPFGHVLTQCVGLEEEPQVHVYTGMVASGDIYLLCSDGLVGMVEDDDIATVLGPLAGASGGLDDAVQSLVDAAKEAGGYDNITVVIARVD